MRSFILPENVPEFLAVEQFLFPGNRYPDQTVLATHFLNDLVMFDHKLTDSFRQVFQSVLGRHSVTPRSI